MHILQLRMLRIKRIFLGTTKVLFIKYLFLLKMESSFLFEESVVGPLQRYWNERKEILLSLQQGVCPEVPKYNYFLHRFHIPKKKHLYDMKQCLQLSLHCCLSMYLTPCAFQGGHFFCVLVL